MEKAQQERDSLKLELQGLEHVRTSDNAYLLARIAELEAALQKAENFIEKVVWETGYGGVTLEGIRAVLQPTTDHEEKSTGN